MPLSFTLDTNCICDIEEKRPAAAKICNLLDRYRAGEIMLWITGVSASERIRGGGYIHNFKDFQQRLSNLGLGDVRILKPLAVWGITFWDWGLWGNEEMSRLRTSIREALFPGLGTYQEYCEREGLAVNEEPMCPKYKNKSLDALIMWTHIHHHGDVFVTSDENFHSPAKKAALVELGAGEILRPGEAVDYTGKL